MDKNNRAQLTVYFNDADSRRLHGRVKRLAKKNHRSMSAEVVSLIEIALNLTDETAVRESVMATGGPVIALYREGLDHEL